MQDLALRGDHILSTLHDQTLRLDTLEQSLCKLNEGKIRDGQVLSQVLSSSQVCRMACLHW
jgi:hypothetical protein